MLNRLKSFLPLVVLVGVAALLGYEHFHNATPAQAQAPKVEASPQPAAAAKGPETTPPPVSPPKTAGHATAKQMGTLEALNKRIAAADEAFQADVKVLQKKNKPFHDAQKAGEELRALVRDIAVESKQAFSCFVAFADEKTKAACDKRKALWALDADGAVVVQ